MTTAEDLTFEPMLGLIATFEVCDTDRRVLGVIAKNDDDDWRVLSTRYGTERVPGRHASREAAAASLLTHAGER